MYFPQIELQLYVQFLINSRYINMDNNFLPRTRRRIYWWLVHNIHELQPEPAVAWCPPPRVDNWVGEDMPHLVIGRISFKIKKKNWSNFVRTFFFFLIVPYGLSPFPFSFVLFGNLGGVSVANALHAEYASDLVDLFLGDGAAVSHVDEHYHLKKSCE